MSSPNTPLGKFYRHKSMAKQRGVAFELTFEEWWDIWQRSGHWEERGRRSGQYVMGRHHDTGPYAVGNVSIIKHTENSSKQSDEGKARILASNRTRGCSKETRAKIGDASRNSWKHRRISP